METVTRPVTSWQLRTRALQLGTRTLVMGVINITPDSFSDGGSFPRPEDAVAHALHLLEQGADLLDLGAESTRPGSHAGRRCAGRERRMRSRRGFFPFWKAS